MLSIAFITSFLTNYGQASLDASPDENLEYTVDSLFVALLTNGDASVDFNMLLKSNKPSTNVTLFGDTVQNLTLADYNDTTIPYSRTEESNKIIVHSQSSSDIHVTYTTPDLVDKQNRNWTFTFFFPDRFLLKIPPQARIIDMHPPAFLTPLGEQNLWGFGPGKVQISYVIGPLGTREEAQAGLMTLEDSIRNIKLNHKGIVLGNITTSLEKARSTFKQGEYLETLSQLSNTFNLLQNSSQKYVLAQNAIKTAEVDLQSKKINGYDTSHPKNSLLRAQDLFVSGKYKEAENAAKQAVNQSSPKIKLSTGITDNVLIIIIALLTTSISLVILYLAYKRRSLKRIIMKDRSEIQSITQFNNSEGKRGVQKKPDGPRDSDFSKEIRDPSPLHLNLSPVSDPSPSEIRDYLQRVVEEIGNVRKNHKQDDSDLNLSKSANDKEWLKQIVYQTKLDKPYLRNEDKNLLDYLCEKQGVAFESEIRNKFVLPRTSLWRLIKRLEREELVETVKIGGQNLVKLKF